MSPLVESLKAYALPEIRSREDRLTLLQFCYALAVAHRPVLEAAKLPELFAQEDGKAAWIRADIHAMGGTVPEFDYPAACLVGSQYYVLLHVHKKAVLGYFAAVEYFTHGVTQEWTEHTHGPAREDRFPLFPMIDAIAMQNPWLGAHILHNANCSAAGIANVLSTRLGTTPTRTKTPDLRPLPGTC